MDHATDHSVDSKWELKRKGELNACPCQYNRGERGQEESPRQTVGSKRELKRKQELNACPGQYNRGERGQEKV